MNKTNLALERIGDMGDFQILCIASPLGGEGAVLDIEFRLICADAKLWAKSPVL